METESELSTADPQGQGELAASVERFVTARSGEKTGVISMSRLPGGASRETWKVELETGSGKRSLILRRDPPGAPPTTERRTEFEILERAHRAGVPVPEVSWLFDADSPVRSAGFFMQVVEGETIPRRILRDDLYAAARGAMAAQCGEILARIHSIAIEGETIPGLIVPGEEPAAAALAQYRMIFDSLGQPHPAFEIGFKWLAERTPSRARPALVHGDFRHGNFIVGPEGIRAVIDWELAHIGDPREDLGWLCVRAWRFGSRGDVGGFGRREDLYAAYEKTSGSALDRDEVAWWEVFGTLKWGVITMVQAFTHLSGRVRSVELAAIGRRTVETEYDLLELIAQSQKET